MDQNLRPYVKSNKTLDIQKNPLNEHPKHSQKIWVRKYLQFYAENFCLSKHVIYMSLLSSANYLSQCMRFPTMWYVRSAKPQISLRIRAVWSEPLPVAWIIYDCYATDWTSFGVSKLNRRLYRLVWVYTCQNATLLEITCHGSFIDNKTDYFRSSFERFNFINTALKELGPFLFDMLIPNTRSKAT